MAKSSGWFSKAWVQKMQVPYRLVVMNNETFKEVGSYKLTLLNLYIALCTLLFIGAALVFVLIFFTPVKRLVPGYQDIKGHSEFIRVERRLRNLEQEVNAYKEYTTRFTKLLNGPEEAGSTTESNKAPNPPVFVDEDIPTTTSTLPNFLPEGLAKNTSTARKEAQEVTTIPIAVDESQLLYSTYLVPPASGEISAGFAPEKKHYGTDILAPKNTPIKAAMDGYVISSDWTVETGNSIGIQHANNIITFYKHNSQLLKKAGDFVKAGEAIAIIGNTGTLSSGPHLHFELWFQGKPLDPANYVRFN